MNGNWRYKELVILRPKSNFSLGCNKKKGLEGFYRWSLLTVAAIEMQSLRKEEKKGKKKKVLRKFQEAKFKELRWYYSTAGIREWKALYSLKWRSVY